MTMQGRLVLGIACAATMACAPRRVEVESGGDVAVREGARAGIERVVSGWPAAARDAANAIAEKYGEPAEVTESMLIWHNTGPWKHTIVHREEVQHAFPMPHADVLEQVIDYRVPPEKVDELAQFDGSIVVNRTRGEMASFCDKESSNFVAMNLAHDLVTDRTRVEDARHELARQVRAIASNQLAAYGTGLQFPVPRGGTGDPDRPADR